MGAPFTDADDRNWSPAEQELKAAIEEDFAFVEAFFHRMQGSGLRLKSIPEMPLPTLAAPYELATVYSLRALELAQGAAVLIERRNFAATFPVLRSLYEVWFAIVFAASRFRAYVLQGEKWLRFDEIARRLLVGRTSQGDGEKVVDVGQMRTEAKKTLAALERDASAELGIEERVEEMYSQLSDGTHPTQWSLVAYFEERADGLGAEWNRKPAGGSEPLLADLRLSLGLVRRFLPVLEVAGDEIAEAAKRVVRADPRVRESTISFLESLLADESALSSSSRPRVEAVLEHLRRGDDEPKPER